MNPHEPWLTKDDENPTLTLILSLRERRVSYSLPFKGEDRVGMGLFSGERDGYQQAYRNGKDYSQGCY